MGSVTKKITLEQDEVLFYDGDSADALYIIQKGQLRLYKPKGKTTVEIAVVRQGEVLGEMAYFDADVTTRNCSASAITTCEVVEIPFESFGKTIKDLSPWLKTIVMTLVERLKKANARIKALDSSSHLNYKTGKDDDFGLLKPNEVSKLLATIYLSLKSHAQAELSKKMVQKKTFFLYASDIYGLSEAKIELMLSILKELRLIDLVRDDKHDLIICDNVDALKVLMIFYNTQRHLTDDKKMEVSRRCCLLLEKVWERVKDRKSDEEIVKAKINDILDSSEGIKFTTEDFNDAIKYDLVCEVLVDEGDVIVPVNFAALDKYLPHLKFMRILNERTHS